MKILGSEKDIKQGIDAVFIDNIAVTYYQEADVCDNDEETQELTVKAENNGGGRYLVLSTERWAVDTPADMLAILEDFKNRAQIED